MDEQRENDLKALKKQLKKPLLDWSVAARCLNSPDKHVCVIRVYPKRDGQPFPTHLWLTCPSLKKLISQVESDGYLSVAKNELDSSEEMMKNHLLDNKRYIEDRVKMLTEEDKKLAEENQSWREKLLESGIGGTSNWSGIRCFHCIYADHLTNLQSGGNGNTMGKVLETLVANSNGKYSLECTWSS